MNAPANLPAAAPAAPTKAISQIDEVRSRLMSDEVKNELSMALPPQMPVEKFQRVAITAINNNPDLVNCIRATLYNAFMRAAQDGLLPDGREAAIVRFNSKDGPKAQYMPMVGGILKKVRNSGELKSVVAEVIHKNDVFTRWIDERGEHMRHEPLTFGERGDIIGVYALATTKDEGVYIEVMTKAQVEDVRAVSRAKNDGPWVTWWDQMAKKTAIRRLSKRLPMSTDLEDLIRRDDELYDLEAKPGAETEPKAPKGTPGRLHKMLGGAKMIEGTSRDVTDVPAVEEPLITPDTDAPPDAGGAPTPEEQAEIKRRESFDARALKCTKCPPYTFATDVKAEMDEHMHEEHAGPAPAPAKPATTPAKKGGAAPGSIFG